jgi:hypothetical protein
MELLAREELPSWQEPRGGFPTQREEEEWEANVAEEKR